MGGKNRPPRRRPQTSKKRPVDPEKARVLLCVMREHTIHDPGALMKNLWQLTSQYGVVEKLSTFTNSHNEEQALVQFEAPQAAELALTHLNTQSVVMTGSDGHPWSVSFAIVPSAIEQLTFRKDDCRNRDFSQDNQNLRDGAASPALDFLWGKHVAGDGWLVPRQADEYQGHIPSIATLPKGSVGHCLYIAFSPSKPAIEDLNVTAELLYRACGQYGSVVAAKIMQQCSSKALVQFETAEDMEAARARLDGSTLLSKRVQARQSHHANASNWTGIQRQSEMDRLKSFSTADAPAPEVAPKCSPPSCTVVVHRANDAVVPFVYERLTKCGAKFPAGTSIQTDSGSSSIDSNSSAAASLAASSGTVVLTFHSVDDAWFCIGLLNGTPYNAPNGPERLCMGFDGPPDPNAKVDEKPGGSKNSAGKKKDIYFELDETLKRVSAAGDGAQEGDDDLYFEIDAKRILKTASADRDAPAEDTDNHPLHDHPAMNGRCGTMPQAQPADRRDGQRSHTQPVPVIPEIEPGLRSAVEVTQARVRTSPVPHTPFDNDDCERAKPAGTEDDGPPQLEEANPFPMFDKDPMIRQLTNPDAQAQAEDPWLLISRQLTNPDTVPNETTRRVGTSDLNYRSLTEDDPALDEETEQLWNIKQINMMTRHMTDPSSVVESDLWARRLLTTPAEYTKTSSAQGPQSGASSPAAQSPAAVSSSFPAIDPAANEPPRQSTYPVTLKNIPRMNPGAMRSSTDPHVPNHP
ncbi:hypothetical protein DIPPA_05247 [Diplonema papillatum]|nr:hypothetical protein DIPPA_05247 [Diplonema papillatum]